MSAACPVQAVNGVGAFAAVAGGAAAVAPSALPQELLQGVGGQGGADQDGCLVVPQDRLPGSMAQHSMACWPMGRSSPCCSYTRVMWVQLTSRPASIQSISPLGSAGATSAAPATSMPRRPLQVDEWDRGRSAVVSRGA